MPLYGTGKFRPTIFRLALFLNDLLSITRNSGVHPDWRLPPGKVLDPTQTRIIFPAAKTQGLKGAVVWYDAIVPDSQRLLMEILRWSCKYSATLLNYVEASELLKGENGVEGVKAIDRMRGESHEYKARVVINAAGPWCRQVASRFDRDQPKLFKPSLAWNVLFNREAPSTYALALVPKRPNGPTYFLLPWKGMLLAGTGHAHTHKSEERPAPSRELLEGFLKDLNLAVPALGLNEDDILHVFSGLVPATKTGSARPAVRERIIDHSKKGGPRGLYSISGVKFTTARRVAEKTLNRIFPTRASCNKDHTRAFEPPQNVRMDRGIFDFNWEPKVNESQWKTDLISIIDEEAVQHLDDLIFRRTTIWENPSRALECSPVISKFFDWDSSRRSQEINRVAERLRNGKIIQ